MIRLSLYDNIDVQCYRVLYFIIEEKNVYPLVFNCKIFRNEKCSHSIQYGREKLNLDSNLHAQVQYKISTNSAHFNYKKVLVC